MPPKTKNKAGGKAESPAPGGTPDEPKTNWAYLMRCRGGTLYAGWTNDLPHRVFAHKSGKGGAKYTHAFGAAALALAEPFATKAEAMQREAALKKMTKAQKEALCAAWAAQNRAVIVPAAPQDDAEIAAIYNWYVQNSTATFRYDPMDAAAAKAWLDGARGTAPVLCAKNSAGGIMAFALAHPWRGAWNAYAWDVETTIYCAPQQRARGAAKPLYAALLAELSAMGYWNAYAVLADPNPESEAFHTAMGFALEGRNPRCGYKFGRWLGISTWRFALHAGRGQPEPVRTLSPRELADCLERAGKMHNMQK